MWKSFVMSGWLRFVASLASDTSIYSKSATILQNSQTELIVDIINSKN